MMKRVLGILMGVWVLTLLTVGDVLILGTTYVIWTHRPLVAIVFLAITSCAWFINGGPYIWMAWTNWKIIWWLYVPDRTTTHWWNRKFWLRCESCGKFGATRTRQDTRYEDDSLNWCTLCPSCRKDNDEYWRERWAATRRMSGRS